MNIKITSDSTCDLGATLIEKYDITLLPLYIAKGGETFRDGVDITADDIFAHVAAGGELCTTSALNLADYVRCFSELSRNYDAVIHICISADFSSCYQNACLAAADYPNVYVVDSRNLSTGHGHVVLRAVELAAAGMSPAQIVSELAAMTPRVRASFVVEQLEYLRRGGRCSAVAALGANLLKLRPCIEVKDGKMGVAKKYRGSMEKCVRDYVLDQLADAQSILTDRVFITHSGVPDSVLNAALDAVKESADFNEIHVTRAGCTVSSHCGPGTLGVLFVIKP